MNILAQFSSYSFLFYPKLSENFGTSDIQKIKMFLFAKENETQLLKNLDILIVY